MDKKRSFPVFIATGFYSGLSPIAPGTMGSLVVLLAFLALSVWAPVFLITPAMVVWSAVLTAISIKSSQWCLDHQVFGEEHGDPKQIVIDEFAGMAVALVGVGTTIEHVFLAFIAFRFFDIVKLPPINKLEKLPGGLGITADDILAGIYANIGVQLTFLLTG
ncbi:MAG: phosphatidylglycerophosphatase A [Bdellovibrionales bacterium]|nr:phosphatidylglycerophosphatase A [Bdellovibrionales bacterium]